MDGMTRRELDFLPIEVKRGNSPLDYFNVKVDSKIPIPDERNIRAYVVYLNLILHVIYTFSS